MTGMYAQTDNAGLPRGIVATILRALNSSLLVVIAASAVAFWLAPAAHADSVTPVAVTNTVQSTNSERAQISREYLIKAAILYNLAKFATWPDTAFSAADAPLRICILGHDPFGPALESLHGKRIGVRKLAIAAFEEVEYAAACHVLFVSASEEQRLAEILDAVSRRPVLTVADFSHFASAGGIVGLTEVDDRSRLEVNIDAAGQAGVKLSSKLLRLAVTVDTQTAQSNVTPKNDP